METVKEESDTAAPSAGRAIWLNAGRSAGIRLAVLVMSSILGILITRLILDTFGRDVYAQYGLLVTMAALIPFADLGISGAIMNAIGGVDDPAHDENVRRVLITSLRISVSAAAVVISISILVTALGWWPTILGPALDPEQGPIAAGVCLALIGLAIPLGVGQRIISALGKNHISIALNGLQSPLVLSMLAVVVWSGAEVGGLIPIIPYIGTLLIVALSTWISLGLLRPVFGIAIRQARHLRTHRGGRVNDMAWPLMVQMIALPMAMQTDRLVLSHVSDTEQLAQYNLASQIFTPVWALVGAAGFTMWPVFAKARARKEYISPMPLALGFGGIAALLCLVLTLLSPLLARLSSGDRISLDPLIVASFSTFMIFQAVKYPLGMFLTHPTGMRFQALMVVCMVPVNLALSIYLAKRLGSAGPIIGSAVGVLMFQVVANYAYIRWSMRAPVPQDVAAAP